MQVVNNVEVLQWSPDQDDYRKMVASATESWQQGAFLYHSAGTVKAWQPADSTAAAAGNQAAIIGIAAAGKKLGEIEATVCLKAKVLMDATGAALGEEMVVVYNPTTGYYTAYEGTLYNTDYDPDITLAGNFLVSAVAAAQIESDHRGVMLVDGKVRFDALN